MKNNKYIRDRKFEYICNFLNKGDFLLISPKTIKNKNFDRISADLDKIKVLVLNVNTKVFKLVLKNTPNEFFKNTIKTTCFICIPKKLKFTALIINNFINKTTSSFTFLGAKINNSFISTSTLQLAQKTLETQSTTTLACQSAIEMLQKILYFNNTKSKLTK